MLGGRSSDEWVAEYSQSHQHPVNRICHTFGIPLIAVSLALFVVAWFVDGFWPVPTTLFVARLGVAVCRPRRRGQAAGVLQGSAVPAGRPALVVREDARQSLKSA